MLCCHEPAAVQAAAKQERIFLGTAGGDRTADRTAPPYLAAEARQVCALRAACRHTHVSALDGAAHGTARNHDQASLEGGAAGSCRGSSKAGSLGQLAESRRSTEVCVGQAS